MEIFGNTNQVRGCYARFNLHRAGNPITLVFNKQSTSDIPGLVVQAVQFSCRDRYSHVMGFNETVFSTAFGYDWLSSVASVTATLMLIPGQNQNISGLPAVLGFYSGNRVYNRREPGYLTIGNAGIKSELIGLQASTTSNEYNLQQVVFELSVDLRDGDIKDVPATQSAARRPLGSTPMRIPSFSLPPMPPSRLR
jgi:hypothetical protein